MIYRIANSTDALKLKELFLRVEHAVKNKAMFHWSSDMIDQEILDSMFYVAEDKAKSDVVAFISFRMSETDDGDVVDIISLGTDPQKQGHGLMTKLLKEFALFFSKKPATIFLEVHIENEKAIKVYNHLGFKVSRVRKSYYSDGKDCLEMMCKVGS